MKRVLFLLLYLVSIISFGNIKTSVYSKVSAIEKWQVFDLVFKADVENENPFVTDFSATFTGPDDIEQCVPGFYNGNKQWIIRFSASTVGDWSFVTKSEMKALSGKKGHVVVKPSTNKNKHGHIITRPENPQHFYYQDGTPYFQLAFECDWLFALDYHNKEAAPKTDHLLNILNENKINQIVTTMYSFDAPWKRDSKLAQHPSHDYGADLSIFPFLGTNEEPDFSQLNVEFFQNFDRVIHMMDEKNINLHLMIYVWNKMVNWPDTESDADNMYFDYIIKRYQAFPNLVWDISKEALNNARCTEEYGLERIQRIRNLDAYKHLVSVHDFGFCKRNPDVVDFISTQDWSLMIYYKMLSSRNQFPQKPIFNIEHGGYEESYYDVFAGNYINAEYCLRRNYEIAFAGTYSTYYWQGTSWNVIIHNPFEQSDNFVKPRFDYYKHLAEFFEKYPFSEFEPEMHSSTYSLRNNNGTVLVYVPKENYEISIYGKNPLSGKGTYQWFNTHTGEFTIEALYEGGHCLNPWHEKADAILIRKQ